MIGIYNNPYLTDFIQVCARMPDDERAQVEAMTGEPYDLDGAVMGNFVAAGPKWVIKDDDLPLCVGGFVAQRKNVWRDFLLTTPEAWAPERFFRVTRICRRVMDYMLLAGNAHRLECLVPAARVESRPELRKWYKILGYHEEGRRFGYCANGADAICFSRVKH